jgi:4-amino-4-deoxy-L-arabinose transferase-like glycosyltransferase
MALTSTRARTLSSRTPSEAPANRRPASEYNLRVTAPRSVALLAALAAVLLVAGLGATALTDRDEGANAEAAREMHEQGAWLTPTLNYAPRFAKPALVYWLMGGAYTLVGVGEAAARLPSALATTALVLVQYAFARWALGPAAAPRAALVLLLAGLTIAVGRMALTDAVLVLCTTAAGYAFFRAHHGEPPRGRWYAATYAALALGTLAKGPVGVLVPLVGILGYLAVAGGGRRALREARPGRGVLLFLAIAGPWYAAMVWLHGGDYLARAQGETVGRVFRTVTGPGGTVLFYLPVVLVALFPWSAFLPDALVRTLRGARARAAGSRAGAAAVFAAVWVVGVLVVFSLFQSRLPHYVAPLVPAAALLVAAAWPARPPGLSRALLAALGLVLGGALLAAVALGPTVGRLVALAYPAEPDTALPGSLAAVGVGALALGATAALSDGARLFRALAVLTAVWLALGLHVAWPAFDARFVAPAAHLARAVARLARSCDTLAVLGPYRPSLVFYARRPVVFVGRRATGRLAELAARPGRLLVLTPAALRPELPPPIDAWPPLAQRGGYVLVAGPPPAACP